MTATPVPREWNTFAHLSPYRYNNSAEGIRTLRRAPGYRRAIDLDFQMSRDGIFLNTHWHHPSVEGFRFTSGRRKGQVPRAPFRLMRARTATRLRTDDGYMIQTAYAAIYYASAHRIRVEAEMKAVPSQKALDRLAALSESFYGPDWRQRVQVKMLRRFRWRTALRRAKRAGFITFLIGFGDGDPATLPDYVDHYRR